MIENSLPSVFLNTFQKKAMIATCTAQAHFGNDAYHAAMFRSKTSVILLTEHVKWMDVYFKMMSCELQYVTLHRKMYINAYPLNRKKR